MMRRTECEVKVIRREVPPLKWSPYPDWLCHYEAVVNDRAIAQSPEWRERDTGLTCKVVGAHYPPREREIAYHELHDKLHAMGWVGVYEHGGVFWRWEKPATKSTEQEYLMRETWRLNFLRGQALITKDEWEERTRKAQDAMAGKMAAGNSSVRVDQQSLGGKRIEQLAPEPRGAGAVKGPYSGDGVVEKSDARRAVDFWASPAWFVVMLFGGGALLILLTGGASVLLVAFMLILLIVYLVAYSKRQGMLSDEEKRREDERDTWYGGQRGP